jgi:methionyl-tRNA formyltransferase
MNILIATLKEWNIKNYFLLKEKYPKYNFFLITSKEELNLENVKKISPDYIFFPHWSFKIPKEIYQNFNSILFHMTDLPFGKGGSPLQNLIMNKIYKTKITALKVEEKIDSGDILLKKDFDISLGSAEEIFIKASKIIFFDMIPYILKNNPVPKKQTGKEVIFKRRTPNESEIKNIKSLEELYDFIRMLDAPGYPKAFIKIDKIMIEFKEVHLKTNKIVGRFEAYEK